MVGGYFLTMFGKFFFEIEQEPVRDDEHVEAVQVWIS